MALNEAILVQAGEGEDSLKAGNDNTGTFAEVAVPQIPLYHLGSKNASKITAPKLYPVGLGDPTKIAAFSHLNALLEQARARLLQEGKDLAVVSGFLSPGNQLARWRTLYATQNRSTPWQEILAGRYADSAGSVAAVIPGGNYATQHGDLMDDLLLVAELQAKADVDDVSTIVAELLQYRANAGKGNGIEIDKMTATSIHNLGHSVNVVLTEGGEPLNMGVGVDIVSPVQAVDYFEKVTPEEYEALLTADPLLLEYLASLGVRQIDEKLIGEVRDNRRLLFQAMRGARFDFYKGEQGHFSAPRDGGNHPSRAYVYAQARASGYTV